MNRETGKAGPVAVTGIKPTGQIHLGNYIGSIRPALDLVPSHRCFYFIADYHALTTVREPGLLQRHVLEAAATWLAMGLDPDRAVFFRQSAVPEILELAWVLACVSPKGLLNRAHAYKAAMEANREAGRDADAEIRAGLFNYPLLMAADILCFHADRVPVGSDQRQHVEMARDAAATFNRAFRPVFRPPRASLPAGAATVPGLDGRKMSNAYGNEIPLLADSDTIRSRVMRIVTDSRPPEAPKDPDRCGVFGIYRHFAPAGDVAALRRRYLAGGVAYRGLKEALADTLIDRFAPHRRRYRELLADPDRLVATLERGAGPAREAAGRTLRQVRRATGLAIRPTGRDARDPQPTTDGGRPAKGPGSRTDPTREEDAMSDSDQQSRQCCFLERTRLVEELRRCDFCATSYEESHRCYRDVARESGRRSRACILE